MGRAKRHRVNILVSSCLLGDMVRFDGGNYYDQDVVDLGKRFNLVSVCPERMGGLKTPREPSEMQPDGRVVSWDRIDNTWNFEEGARIALKIAQDNNCKIAILKSKSPSCGKGQIFDGTFKGNLVPGYGITAQLLIQNGITVYTQDEIDKII